LEGVTPTNTLKFKAEGMRKFKDRIPDEVLKKIFPQKIKRSPASEQVYSYLKSTILSGKLKKGQRLLRCEFIPFFKVNETAVSTAFSQLKKDGLIISKGNKRWFVV
jgi:DNA-binding GntR family transcriptional regulator